MRGVMRLFSNEYFTRKTTPRNRTKPPIQAKSFTPMNASQSIARRTGGGGGGDVVRLGDGIGNGGGTLADAGIGDGGGGLAGSAGISAAVASATTAGGEGA